MEIRLWGADAPESEQPLGPEAGHHLTELLRNQRDTLRMELLELDVYGRIVGLLFWQSRGRADSINQEMVRSGYAYHNPRYYWLSPFGFPSAERYARRSKLGLWRLSPNERERPWNYRARTHTRGDTRRQWRWLGSIKRTLGALLVPGAVLAFALYLLFVLDLFWWTVLGIALIAAGALALKHYTRLW